MTDAPSTTRPRRRYMDWARGIAVLIMIEAHTLDSWTRAADRSSKGYGYLLMLGGLAAPLFLWLAGLGIAMSAEHTLVRTGSRSAATRAVVKRGAEIFILAFLFRLQSFVASPGSPPITVFRVDILNVMGPSIAVAGLLWGVSGGSRKAAALCALVGAFLALVTPIVRVAAWVSVLPIWVQWYLRPAGDYTTFTLLPWSAFVFAGVAYGLILGSPPDQRAERLRLAGLTLAAGVLFAVSDYTSYQPSIYQESSFWTSSPTYFGIRVAVVMGILALCYALTPLAARLPAAFSVLELFGRNSLFVYWIHVEFVYGYATWILHRRLPLWGTSLANLILCLLMYWAILKRDQLVDWWRSGRSRKTIGPQPAAAGA